MSNDAIQTILAFDFGERRIGVAVGQTLTRTANALCVLPARAGKPGWDRVAALVAEWGPDRFVVGMPTTADGSRHRLAAAIERFARQLEGRFRKPSAFVDERLSSHAAQAAGGRSKQGLDAEAARLILETWLAEQASNTRTTP